jgi:hypothetical protein
MLQPSDLSWWLWVASGALFAAWLGGVAWACGLLLALSGFQVAYFRLRDARFSAFRVQVRIAYGLLVLCTAWKPLHWLAYVPAIGTWTQVIFGYCALARLLSLMPWNRGEPMTWRLAWRTFTAPLTSSVMPASPADGQTSPPRRSDPSTEEVFQ